MSINQKSSHFYQLDNQILKQVEVNPYLGVILLEDLKFSPHIRNITKKANSTLGFLKRKLKHCSKSCKKTASLALLRSTLEYSAVVWDPHLQEEIDQLERVQCRSARFITIDYSSRDQGSITRMLDNLELTPLQDRRRSARLAYLPAMPSHDFLTPNHS